MRRMRICGRLVGVANTFIALALGLLVVSGPALAQGRSDSAPGQSKDKDAKSDNPGTQKSGSSGSSSSPSRQPSLAAESGIGSPVTSSAATSAPAAAANAVVYYGSWLDDASIVSPGDVWIALATGYWRGDSNRQFDVPVVSAAVGITSRFQAGGSASFYHFRDPDGLTESGAGTFSAYGKFQLLDPMRAENAIGIAITPLIELSPGSSERFGWALPVNIETQRGNLRVYGSAGYFSRGSVFGTIGADIPVGSRFALSANVGQSYASAGSHQTSFGAGFSVGLTPKSGAYVGVGQTFMPTAIGPSGVSLAGGISFLLPQPKAP
jgi:hypothetical protein